MEKETRYVVKDDRGKVVGIVFYDPIAGLETYKKALIRVERERDAAIERCKRLQRANTKIKAENFDLVSAHEARKLVIMHPSKPVHSLIQGVKSYFKIRNLLKK
jgi:hypothetical protein